MPAKIKVAEIGFAPHRNVVFAFVPFPGRLQVLMRPLDDDVFRPVYKKVQDVDAFAFFQVLDNIAKDNQIECILVLILNKSLNRLDMNLIINIFELELLDIAFIDLDCFDTGLVVYRADHVGVLARARADVQDSLGLDFSDESFDSLIKA